jgi:hypothetical protein
VKSKESDLGREDFLRSASFMLLRFYPFELGEKRVEGEQEN